MHQPAKRPHRLPANGGEALKQLHSLVDAMGDGLIVVDQDHRFLIFNQEARRIFGVGPDEPSVERWAAYYGLYLPDKLTPCPMAELPLVRALRGERDNLDVYVRPPGHGTGRWLNCTLSPVLDEHGSVTAGITVFRDVTEQVDARSELAESKRRLEQAQRAAHLGSWEWDLRTQEVTWSDEHFRLVGLEPRSVKPSFEGFLAFIVPEDRGRVERTIQDALLHHRPYRSEYRVAHADGSIRVLQGEGEVIFDAEGKPERMQGITKDVTEQKRTEAALNEGRAKIQAIIENTSDAVYLKDVEGRYVLLNTAGAAIQNLTVDEVLGKRDIERFSPQTARRLREVDEQVMASKQTMTVEETVELAPGDLHVYSSVKAPYLGRDGEVLGVIGISRDITEQKHAQQELGRSREQLAEAQRIAHLGSWEWELATDRVTWSDEIYRVLGEEPQAFAPSVEHLLERVHPDDRGRVAAEVQLLRRQGNLDHQFRVVRADGEVRMLRGRGRVVALAEGKPCVAIGTVQDVTEQQRAEDAIRRSHALLEAQQAASIDGILVVDEHRLVINHNQRFLDLWGLPDVVAREEEPLVAQALVRVQDPDAFLKRVNWLYQHPTEASRDEIELKDGRTLDRYSAPALFPDGSSCGRVWFFRDITHRKRLEEQLQSQFQALKDLDQIKSNFVNAVTHELRTPLTSIMGYAEFLEDGIGGPLSPEQDEYVRQLLVGARRLEALLNDLLDFARMEAGTFRVAIQPSDLNRKVKEILASLQPQAKVARLSLEDRTGEPALCVPMDAQRIGQVLINLVGNAIKFTPPGGTIRVWTGVEGDGVVCKVADSGPGISPADIPKLFNRFTQLEAGLQKKVGAGLGLSISKSIVEAHGGRIGVESRTGEGAVFWFWLPSGPRG